MMKNSTLLEQIILKLEEEHLNLYHDVTKEEIQDHINKIKDIDNLSSVEFDYEMMKLFAMFKDAHTSYYVPFRPLSYRIMLLDDKFYVKKGDIWEQIESFGRYSAQEFYEELKLIENYETQERLNFLISIDANNGYFYEMLNLFNNCAVELTLKNGEKINLKLCEVDAEKIKSIKKRMPYGYKILDENILYLRYSKCANDDELPFDLFVDQLSKEIEAKGIKNYILDVRGNQGGNSEILNPFQKLVSEQNLKGCLLIDNGVFSSGRFAVARFKKKFNATLIGQATGGAAKSYGFNKNFQIEGKNFSASTRIWDFSDVFGYEGAIQPDIFVKVTVDDVQNKRDVILEKGIEFVKSKLQNANLNENLSL